MAQPRMSSVIDVDIKGLYLNPSTFGDNAPNGALTIADNVVIDRPSVVSPRRGYSNAFSTLLNDGVRSLYTYNNIMLMNTNNNFMQMFLATGGEFDPDQPLDMEEDVEVLLVSMDELIDLIQSQQFIQSMQLSTLFFALQKLGRIVVK